MKQLELMIEYWDADLVEYREAVFIGVQYSSCDSNHLHLYVLDNGSRNGTCVSLETVEEKRDMYHYLLSEGYIPER